MENSCKNLKKLLEAEIPVLKAAIGHRRQIISRTESISIEDVDLEVAKKYFLSNGGLDLMEGFRLAYCSYICEDRESCDMLSEMDRWKKYGV